MVAGAAEEPNNVFFCHLACLPDIQVACKDVEECLGSPYLYKTKSSRRVSQLQEVRSSDPESHFRYIRMSKEGFDC